MSGIDNIFNQLITIGTGVGVTVAAFFLMWGAYLYMSAAGSPRQMESGKTAMVNSLAGLVVVLAARTIANLVGGAVH